MRLAQTGACPPLLARPRAGSRSSSPASRAGRAHWALWRGAPPRPLLPSNRFRRLPSSRSPAVPCPPRSVHMTQLFKSSPASVKAHAVNHGRSSEWTGASSHHRDGGGAPQAEPPRSPSGTAPLPASPRPESKVGKSPAVAGGVPAAKRARRTEGVLLSVASPRKAATPVTPAPSHSGSEDSGAGGVSTGPARRPPPLAVLPPSTDDEALARRLHAELNCTPARTSRQQRGGPLAAAARDRLHGQDPGLLPSC
jgi:hypothetical protein